MGKTLIIFSYEISAHIANLDVYKCEHVLNVGPDQR